MTRSFSLSAYLALSRQRSGESSSGGSVANRSAARPSGELIWGHATSETRVAALIQITTRLRAHRPDLHLLLTLDPDLEPPDNDRSFITVLPVPAETPGDVAAFLDHWTPDMCLWTGGHLRHALINTAADSGIVLFLIDAGESGFSSSRWNWLTDLTRGTLRRFGKVLASTANSANRLLKLGVPPENITITGPLIEGTAALGCNEAARDLMARVLDGRPVWLAAMVQPGEVPLVVAAHRVALRSAHRRLLVLVPDSIALGDDITRTLRGDGWRVAQWSRGEHPDESSQILIADTKGEMGLWYRLAPVTLMASSLEAGHGGQDPFEPAGLGSAILHGPNVSRHTNTYARLASAGAARVVRDADTLAAAVTLLTAPDQAASMAHAAWEVTTSGAEVTDRVMDLIQDTLDRKAAS